MMENSRIQRFYFAGRGLECVHPQAFQQPLYIYDDMIDWLLPNREISVSRAYPLLLQPLSLEIMTLLNLSLARCSFHPWLDHCTPTHFSIHIFALIRDIAAFLQDLLLKRSHCHNHRIPFNQKGTSTHVFPSVDRSYI